MCSSLSVVASVSPSRQPTSFSEKRQPTLGTEPPVTENVARSFRPERTAQRASFSAARGLTYPRDGSDSVALSPSRVLSGESCGDVLWSASRVPRRRAAPRTGRPEFRARCSAGRFPVLPREMHTCPSLGPSCPSLGPSTPLADGTHVPFQRTGKEVHRESLICQVDQPLPTVSH